MVSVQTAKLPPGQRETPLQRFGFPHFLRSSPIIPRDPAITVFGAVRRPFQLPLSELIHDLPRQELTADLHCATTWSARALG